MGGREGVHGQSCMSCMYLVCACCMYVCLYLCTCVCIYVCITDVYIHVHVRMPALYL